MKFIIALLFVLSTFAQQKTVYIAYIDGEIDLGLAPYITRVISEAEQNNADAIIFKINTFGGRVDAATQIKDAILSSKVLTIAFINNRAISAGALIALSCNKIVMVPGSSIGAATVVDETGKKVGEKYQSYMRSEMRSTAEKNNRRTDIAEGMVDERVVVEGLSDSTTLITLTSEEAHKYKIADTVITDFTDMLKAFNLQNAEEVTLTSNWAEDVVRFLNNPIVSSILIMIGFFGLMAEIKTPGWGVAGTTASDSFNIVFWVIIYSSACFPFRNITFYNWLKPAGCGDFCYSRFWYSRNFRNCLNLRLYLSCTIRKQAILRYGTSIFCNYPIIRCNPFCFTWYVFSCEIFTKIFKV